ncbi:hypothetical protein HYFRA_00010630 [Hymenoscyphus fraxineus]|uniref:Cytochrome P450 n=1 Tax=Hymenoscyphus fraxineus TaxID=746836 RepID=A0A9N9L7W4_9HELO|nr:hypothetical protein HYFRA_00010630 [Hymenoscyphus fraxineus]
MSSDIPFLLLYLPSWRLCVQSCVVLISVKILSFFFKIYTIRRRFQRMQKDGLPMPPHHPILGHLKLIAEITTNLPPDIHPHILPHQISLLFPDLPPVFYLDTYPFGPPLLIVASPEAAHQVTHVHSLPKFHTLKEFMRPMTGGEDLVTMEGSEWKTWRGVFNPGFAGGYLMTLVPGMVRDVGVLCEVLGEEAKKGGVVRLDEVVMRCGFDVIWRVVVDTNLNSQRTTNPFIKALRSQTRWLSFGNEANLFERYHPLRPIMQWWNNRRMHQYISHELDTRYQTQNPSSKNVNTPRSKSIIDLALTSYTTLHPKSNPSKTIDPKFKALAIAQIRTFLFAGHDTTSSTISYTFHLLSQHPHTLSLLISEHNNILGPYHDTKTLSSLLSSNPHILNELPYTTAIIKESLRLHPPASTTRAGLPGASLSSCGQQLPTDTFLVWITSYSLHRSPTYWDSPNQFMPERWLSPHPVPVKGAFRPFEEGKRNCIGQELAMLEMKVVLVMVVRGWVVRSVYEEVDGKEGGQEEGKMVAGERAYQVLRGGARPRGGMPCRVEVRGEGV